MEVNDDIATFIATQAVNFRKKVLELDSSFFKNPENQVIYKDFCQNLAYIWMNNHNQNKPIGLDNWPGAGGTNGNNIN